MEPKKALEIVRQVVENISLKYQDHQLLQEALSVLAKEIAGNEACCSKPAKPTEKDY